jgi:hypothetical protein
MTHPGDPGLSSELPPNRSHRPSRPSIGIPLGCLLIALGIVAGGMLITVITSLGR